MDTPDSRLEQPMEDTREQVSRWWECRDCGARDSEDALLDIETMIETVCEDCGALFDYDEMPLEPGVETCPECGSESVGSPIGRCPDCKSGRIYWEE